MELFNDPQIRLKKELEFDRLLDEVGKIAAENGLTETILEELLANDDEEVK